MSKLKTAQ